MGELAVSSLRYLRSPSPSSFRQSPSGSVPVGCNRSPGFSPFPWKPDMLGRKAYHLHTCKKKYENFVGMHLLKANAIEQVGHNDYFEKKALLILSTSSV